MTHPQTQDDEAKPGVVVSNEGMTFADVAEHYQENGGLVKLGVAPDGDEALVEVMARAIVHADTTFWAESEMLYSRHLARAALTALRNHEGRKG